MLRVIQVGFGRPISYGGPFTTWFEPGMISKMVAQMPNKDPYYKCSRMTKTHSDALLCRGTSGNIEQKMQDNFTWWKNLDRYKHLSDWQNLSEVLVLAYQSLIENNNT